MKTKAANTKIKISFWENTKLMKWSLVIFSFILYANTIGNDYNMDDDLVTMNHRLTSKGIKAIPEIIKSPYYQDQMGYAYEYRPIVHISFAIEKSLLGESPGKSHFINALLYSVLILVVFNVSLTIFSTLPTWVSFWGVLIFSAHPIHTEVVASIKNRDEILSLLFGFLSLWSANKFFLNKNYFYLIASAFLLIIALLSKMSAAAFIVVIPYMLALINKNASIVSIGILSFIFHIIGLWLLPLYDIWTFLPFFVISSMIPPSIHFLKQNKIDVLNLKNSLSLQFNETYQTNLSDFRLLFKNASFESSFFMSFIVGLISYIIGYLAISVNTNAWLLYMLISINLIYFLIPVIEKIEHRILPLMFLTLATSSKFYFGTEVLIVCTLIYFLGLFKQPNLINYMSVLSFIIFNSFFSKEYSIVIIFISLSTIYFRKYTYLKIVPIFFGIIAFLDVVKITIDTLGDINYKLLSDFAIVVSSIVLSLMLLNIKKEFSAKFISLLLALVIGSAVIDHIITNVKQPCKGEKAIIEKKVSKHKKFTSISPLIDTETDRPLTMLEVPIDSTTGLSQKSGLYANAVLFYFKKIIVPYPLSFYYGYSCFKPEHFFQTKFIFYLLAISAIIILILIICNFDFMVIANLLWLIVGVLSISGIGYPVPGSVGERFAFFPSFGICMLIPQIGYHIILKREAVLNYAQLPANFKYALMVILVIFSILTLTRNSSWKNPITLMSTDIKKVECSAQAHNLYATNLMKYSYQPEYQTEAQNMRTRALESMKKAIQIFPNFMNFHYDLGRIYLSIDDVENANIQFIKVHAMDSTFSDATYQLAKIYLNKQDTVQAMKMYETLTNNDKTNKLAFDDYTFLLYKTKNYTKSIETLKIGLRHNPSWEDYKTNLATVYETIGLKDSALLYKLKKEKN